MRTANAICVALTLALAAVAIADDKGVPKGSTIVPAIEFYCPKLENVMFADDGRLIVGKDSFRLSSGRNDTLVFTGATGIAILRGDAKLDGNLYFDNARLTVAGKDYQCVAM